MTKEKTSLNDFLTMVEKLKQDVLSCKNFLKSENIQNKLDESLKQAFYFYENQGDKGGFLRLLFDYDKKVGGWVKPSIFKKDILAYFDFCNIEYGFTTKSKTFIITYDKKDIVSFVEYKKKVLEISKENRELVKDKLSRVKLPFTFDKLSQEQLEACIIQAKKALKDLSKKDK